MSSLRAKQQLATGHLQPCMLGGLPKPSSGVEGKEMEEKYCSHWGCIAQWRTVRPETQRDSCLPEGVASEPLLHSTPAYLSSWHWALALALSIRVMLYPPTQAH